MRENSFSLLRAQAISRPLEVLSHIKLTLPKQNDFMLYEIMFYAVEAALSNSY